MRQTVFPLGLLGAGEEGEITALRDDRQRACTWRAEDLGLRVGKTVAMLTNGGGGPLLLKVDESRLAIDLRVAMRILVRRAR